MPGFVYACMKITYQEEPFEELHGHTLPAKRNPGDKYTSHSTDKPYDIETACCSVQLVHRRITHPQQHHATANRN